MEEDASNELPQVSINKLEINAKAENSDTVQKKDVSVDSTIL